MVLSRRIPIIFSGDFLRFPKPSPYQIFVSLYDRGGILLLYEELCIGACLWTCLRDSFGVPVYGPLAIPYAVPHVRALNRVTCLGPALGTCLGDWGGDLFMVLGIFTVALPSMVGTVSSPPSAAVVNDMGISQWRSSPSRWKTS